MQVSAFRLISYAVVNFVLMANLAMAGTLDVEITGKIGNFTDASRKIFFLSENNVVSMKKYSIVTSTNWTNKETFSGFSGEDLMEKIKAQGDSLEFHCLDEYVYAVPISDIKKYHLIFAYERNGKRMPVRELGPLALIYPRSEYPEELSGSDTDAKFIWQIKKIIVK
jgi:hypothetical protein